VKANRIAIVKKESRFREIMVALLVVEFGALCNAARFKSKERAECPHSGVRRKTEHTTRASFAWQYVAQRLDKS